MKQVEATKKVLCDKNQKQMKNFLSFNQKW